MKYLYGLTVVMLACLAGCKKDPPPPPEAAPPPPLTTSQIISEYKAALQPLLNAATPGVVFDDGQKTPIINEFNTTRAKMASEINEPEARDKIEGDVTNGLKQAKEAEQWFVVDGLLDVYKILRPDSQVYTSLRRRADLMMARPVVVCTGFATIGSEDLLTFLEITDPKSKKTDTFRIREGEEFYPGANGKSLLKLIRVVGAQSAVEMEYLALPGETWEIPGPKNN